MNRRNKTIDMKLHWHPIQPYKKIIEAEKDMAKENKTAGIYIWGFMNNDNFMPYYVGKAGNICQRLCSHINCLKGGAYTVYTKEDLFDFESDKPFYKPDSVESRVQFVANEFNKPELQEHVKFMIDNFHFTYSSMSYPEFKKYGAEAERVILNWLKMIICNTRIGQDSNQIPKGNLELLDNKYLQLI